MKHTPQWVAMLILSLSALVVVILCTCYETAKADEYSYRTGKSPYAYGQYNGYYNQFNWGPNGFSWNTPRRNLYVPPAQPYYQPYYQPYFAPLPPPVIVQPHHGHRHRGCN